MNTHANAPLSVEGRRRLVERCQHRPIAHVAKEMGISRTCASKWVNRHKDLGEAGLCTISHALLTSLPMWVSWIEANWCVNLDGWWQHPALVIELDTAWRTWRNAWGPSGTDQAKASWLYDWNVTLGRIVETPKTYMKMLTSSQFTPAVFTDAPSGTLGIVPNFPLQNVPILDGLTGEIIKPLKPE